MDTRWRLRVPAWICRNVDTPGALWTAAKEGADNQAEISETVRSGEEEADDEIVERISEELAGRADEVENWGP